MEPALLKVTVPPPAAAAPGVFGAQAKDIGNTNAESAKKSDFAKVMESDASASSKPDADQAAVQSAGSKPQAQEGNQEQESTLGSETAAAASSQPATVPEQTGSQPADAALTALALIIAQEAPAAAANDETSAILFPNTASPLSKTGGLQANPNPPYPPLPVVHPLIAAAEVASGDTPASASAAQSQTANAVLLAQDIDASVAIALEMEGEVPQPQIAKPVALPQAMPEIGALPKAQLQTNVQSDTAAQQPAQPVATTFPDVSAKAAVILPQIQQQASEGISNSQSATPSKDMAETADKANAAQSVANTKTAEALSLLRDLMNLRGVSDARDSASLPSTASHVPQSILSASLLADYDSTAEDDFRQSGNTSAPTSVPGSISLSDAKAAQTESPFSKLLHSTQHTPAAEQVVVQIKTMASTGANSIKIQLEPAELGKVEVQMHVAADGRTSVTVTADNRLTLEALQREARELAQALRDVGLKADMGSLSFNLRGEQQQQQQFTASAYTKVASLDEEEQDYYTSAAHVWQVQARGGVDIRV